MAFLVEGDRIEMRFAGAKEALVRPYARALARSNDYERVEALVGGGEDVTPQE